MISTKATPTRCPRCKVWTLRGYDDGLPACADPYALTRDQEAAAILAGRWCYTLTSGQLIKRDGYLRRGPVLAEHLCGQPIGSVVVAKRPMAAIHAAPPY